jgi:tRNA threonylcarbamoyladenosine biosynthesis protein TsaE
VEKFQMSHQFTIPSTAALPDVARQILDALHWQPAKVALYGDMGAGKTTLVRALCEALGVTDQPSSPTFSLINEYAYTAPDGSAALVHHLDLYRLRNAEEAFDIGIEDVLYDPWWCFIEWPQVVEPMLPEGTVALRIEVVNEEERVVRIF